MEPKESPVAGDEEISPCVPGKTTDIGIKSSGSAACAAFACISLGWCVIRILKSHLID
jgi:hypothetical protein